MAIAGDQIDQLWHQYKLTGDERAKEQLVVACMPCIHAIARELRQKYGGAPKYQDLVDAGTLGLVEALNRFDETRGARFTTWLYCRVRGAMIDDQRKKLYASDAIRLKTRRLRRVADEMTTAQGRSPTDEDLAEALRTSIAEVAELRRHAKHSKPISLQSTQADSAPDHDPALQDKRSDPSRAAIAKEGRARLLNALKSLPDKQRLAILLRYYDELRMCQIAKVLEVSPSRVTQLLKEGLETLARRLGPRMDEFLDALGG